MVHASGVAGVVAQNRYTGVEALETRDIAVQILREIRDRIDATNARLESFEARFAAIDARFDGVDARFDGVDGRLFARLR